MYSRIIRLMALTALIGVAGISSAYAIQPLEAKAVDSCAPWDGAAVEVSVPLKSGKVFVARVWQPANLSTTRGVELDKDETGFGNGNASICDDPEHTHFMDCKAVSARINIIDAKGGDTGAGTLYIEDMGTFPLNVHWTHTPQFCG